MTLRVGNQLVGVRADSGRTLGRLRALFAAWIDDGHRDVPWVFDVRLDPALDLPDVRTSRGTREKTTGDGVIAAGSRPVPQLRMGQVLMARSRSDNDVLRALAAVVGGVLASQDESRVWSRLRAFGRNDRIVLLDARPPAFTADAALTRAGIVEVPTWAVAVEGTNVHVPPPLDGLDWSAADLDPLPTTWRIAELAGLVAFDPLPGEHQQHSLGRAASALSTFALATPSGRWFSTVERLVRHERVAVCSNRTIARQRITEFADP